MFLNGFLDVNVCSKVLGAVFSRVFAWEKFMLSRWVFLTVCSLDCGYCSLGIMLMEWKALIEQDKQDLEEISVQTSDKDLEKTKDKRSAEEKLVDIGRLHVSPHSIKTKQI